MLLSILVPVYNESTTIMEILERVFAQSWPIDIEVIVVNDASTDDTREKLDSITDHRPNLRVYHHSVNCGKGAAICTAMNKAKGEIVAIQDADLEYDPGDLVKLLTPILEDKADVVYGSRFMEGCPSSRFHCWGNGLLTALSNLFTGLKLTDMETCYKVIRKSFLEGIKIRSERFGIEPELTAKLARRKARFVEMPISYSFRSYAEGKKITWRDGVKAVLSILYFRFRD
ncbi:MAG: glycosyltransferase family 2 protein [Phycisphaerae bacterium]|jgi:glycosyltransferase involved in cell wall biosynthesis|nr:glycosyltransferase family 2 protein [Phycisphaerae bacterium]